MPPLLHRPRRQAVTGAASLLAAGVLTALVVSATPGAAAPAGADPAAAFLSPGTAAEAATAETGTRAGSGSPSGAAGTTARSTSAIDHGLERRLVDRLSHSTAGRFGMVVSIEGRGLVATIHPRGAMRPASTQKLFTTLPHLLSDPDRRLVTDVAVAHKPHAGVLHGNLVVHASGDPSLLKKHLNQLGRQIRNAGIRRVTGHLVLDIGDLPLRTRRAGWPSGSIPWDVGPLSPFPVWEDVWRHDSAYISHPTKSNLSLFRDRLAQQGVRVRGSNRIVRASTADQVVAVHRSAPMHGLIKHTLRISDNFYAEQLLTIGGGHRPVKELVAAAGVTDVSNATDGSGLSYDDRQSPRGEVQLLDWATTTPAIGDLRTAMPRACRSGTLEHRFCGTIGAGKVVAKTGTLWHSTALAGYTTDAKHRRVTFSVITAGVRSITAAVKATDRAVLVLRRYDR